MRIKHVTHSTVSHRRRNLLLGGASMIAAGTLPSIPALAQGAPVTIGVGADPVFTAFFVAANEKLFAKHGANVQVQSYTDGGEALNALVANQVNMACAGEPTHIVRLSRAELRPLAVTYQSKTYLKLVARKGIAKADQIKKFGIVAGSVSEYVTGLTLKKLNIDSSKVEMVRSGPPELPALLARGDIDGYFVWEPWPTLGVQQGGHILMTCGDVGYTSTLWLSATASWLGANKEVAGNILKALAEAAEITRKDPPRAAQSVQAITRIPVPQTLNSLKDMDPVIRDFTDDDLKTANAIGDFLLSKQAIKAPVDMSKILQRGFYKG
jgi:NitT/TauT family transport system substrate-binding protein